MDRDRLIQVQLHVSEHAHATHGLDQQAPASVRMLVTPLQLQPAGGAVHTASGPSKDAPLPVQVTQSHVMFRAP